MNINFGNNKILNIAYNIMVNFSTCQFRFILGVLFVKENIISKLRIEIYNHKYRKILMVLMSLAVFIINILIETYIIEPIIAIIIIIIIAISNPNKYIEKLLLYISKHLTNIWLTHMFFYMIFFKKLIYNLVLDILKSIEIKKSIIEIEQS